MPGSRKLGRTTDHRKAMLRAMVTFLLENGQIETTVTRAKEVRAVCRKDDHHRKDQRLTFEASGYGICHKGKRCQEAVR